MHPQVGAHRYQGTVGVIEGVAQQQCCIRQRGGKEKCRDACYCCFHEYSETDRDACRADRLMPIIARREKL